MSNFIPMDHVKALTSSPTRLAGLDVLQMELVPLANRYSFLTNRLAHMLKRACALYRDGSKNPYVPERGLMCQLKEVEYSLRPGMLQKSVARTRSDLVNFFNNSSAGSADGNNGQVLFYTSKDKLYLFVCVIPPRQHGEELGISRIHRMLQAEELCIEVDYAALEHALVAAWKQHDVVWGALIGQGKPAVPARMDQVQFNRHIIDKTFFKQNVQKMKSLFSPVQSAVQEGDAIGTLICSQQAAVGTNIYGEPIAPLSPEVLIELSDDLELESNGVIRSHAAGCVVKDGAMICVMPVYCINKPEAGKVDVHFSGTVIVNGTLTGPGTVECDDLYVLGNCEQIAVTAKSDVFISDGIVGHHKSVIEADGGIYVGYASEATLSALGEIIVVNAIINCTVISNIRIQVTSPKGMVAGGQLMSLQKIIVPTIGSEFGMLTETVVGQDFLTTARLKDIQQKITLNEQNLERIEELKALMARSRLSVDRMPPAKQEIFIGVLRKERATREELKVLQRRKATMDTGIKNFLEGSIQVLDSLYPPVRVQIGDAEMNIRERFHAVTLTYNEKNGIISNERNESGVQGDG